MLVADIKPRKSEFMPSRETGAFCLASYLGLIALIWAELEMQLPIDQRGFSAGSDGKESSCNAGNMDLIPGLEKEMATHSSILAWKILWREEPGGYSPWGCKELDTT